jgi:glutaredoxin
MGKRTIEIFVAGCPLCDDAIKQVRSIACSSCDIHIIDMRMDSSALEKAAKYRVKRVPAVVIDGQLADCCVQGAIDLYTLKSLGVGTQL